MSAASRPTVAQWRERGAFVELLEHRIFYVDSRPDRPPVLLLHGFPTSSWDWVDLWPRLDEQFRLIAPDFLGFGSSAKPPGYKYTIYEQADLIEALIRELEVSTFHVIAHDYGVTVAQELLARQNAQVGEGQWRSVCFLNGGLFPEVHRARPIQKLLASAAGPWIAPLIGRRTFEANMRRIFGPDSPPSQEHLDRMWSLLVADDGKRAIPGLLAYIREREEHRARWVGALTDSRIPIAVINGALDPVSGGHMVDRFREVVPGPNFIEILPAVGHYPQTEAPDAVAQAWLRFIGSGTGDLQSKPSDRDQ